MKESLERIVAWAKEHPWLAALIVGGVILVGYLVYRYTQRTGAGDMTQGVPVGGGTSGSTSGDQTVPPNQIAGGGGGTLQPPIINTPPPLQVGGGGGFGGGGGGGGYAPIGSSGFAYPTPDMSGATAIGGPSAMAPASDVQNAAVAPLAQLAAAFNPPAGATMVQNVQAPARLVMPSAVSDLANAAAGVGARGRGGGAAGVLTPAQQVGKGRNFTGTYKGVTYTNGFPTGYGGYTQGGGFQYTIPTAGGGTFTQTISQAMLNYGSRTPGTMQPAPAGGMNVLHGG